MIEVPFSLSKKLFQKTAFVILDKSETVKEPLPPGEVSRRMA